MFYISVSVSGERQASGNTQIACLNRFELIELDAWGTKIYVIGLGLRLIGKASGQAAGRNYELRVRVNGIPIPLKIDIQILNRFVPGGGLRNLERALAFGILLRAVNRNIHRELA